MNPLRRRKKLPLLLPYLKDTVRRFTANVPARIKARVFAAVAGALMGAAYGAFEAVLGGGVFALIVAPIVLGFVAVGGSIIRGGRSSED